MPACPEIDVLRWNTTHVYVKCPYCEEIHRHDSEFPAIRGQCVSLCEPPGEYEFVLPINECGGLVGYEIDKSRAFFVNIDYSGQKFDDDKDDEGDELADLFEARLNISGLIPPDLTDGHEMISIPSDDGKVHEQKRIVFAMSACVSGDVTAVRHYLATCTEKPGFMHGVDQEGNTALILAAAQQSSEMVELLLQHGAEANETNNHGRTALMEAALWGRLENAKVLLEACAWRSVKDRHKLTAEDIAQPTQRNRKERHRRSSDPKSHGPERDIARRHIAILLSNSPLTKSRNYSQPLTVNQRKGGRNFTFRKDADTSRIVLRGPLDEYPVYDIWKTTAVLDRGTQFPRMTSISGWASDLLPPSNPSWTEQVFHIAALVRHELRRDSRDGEHSKPGTFLACHAEKKLIAYFIDKHVFTLRDYGQSRKLAARISGIETEIQDARATAPKWDRICVLEDEKSYLEPESELYGADDAKVKEMKTRISTIEAEMRRLESSPAVVQMRSQQQSLKPLIERRNKRQVLAHLREHAPPMLKKAVIMSSNPICVDCEAFKEKVNACFELEIELEWVG